MIEEKKDEKQKESNMKEEKMKEKESSMMEEKDMEKEKESNMKEEKMKDSVTLHVSFKEEISIVLKQISNNLEESNALLKENKRLFKAFICDEKFFETKVNQKVS